jgi:hypothetical protein
VPLVSKPASFARRAERLAGAGTGPHGSVVWPSGKAQGKRPSADAGEEMALDVSGEVGGSNIDN